MDIDITQDYWFSLRSYTYVSFGKENILLYNTKTGNYIETSNKTCILLIKSIHEKKNLGVIKLIKNDFRDKDFLDLIKRIYEYDLGEINDVRIYNKKPIRLMPILNLQRDVERLKRQGDRSFGEEVLHYLSNIVLYLNNSCSQNCIFCSSYYKQINCCTKENIHHEISFEIIKKLISQIEYAPVGTIQITGGDILHYSNIHKLSTLFPSSIKLHYWMHYINFASNTNFELLSSFIYKDIIINFPLHNKLLEKSFKMIDNDTTLHFIIEDISQFKKVETIIEKYNLKSYQIKPFYNANNNGFFEEFIYLSKDDLFSEIISQRKIFCNQALNSNYFGSLTIFSDGSLRANPYTRIIGNIYDDLVIDIIAREMNENTAWRKIRNNKPCNSCLYQYLCPPPSNYEHAINKYNLCNIINE